MSEAVLLADIEVLPLDDKTIQKCVDEIKRSGLKHVVGPSSSTVQGMSLGVK